MARAADVAIGVQRKDSHGQLGRSGRHLPDDAATTENWTSLGSNPSAPCTVISQMPTLSRITVAVNVVADCTVIAPPAYVVHTPLGASSRVDSPRKIRG